MRRAAGIAVTAGVAVIVAVGGVGAAVGASHSNSGYRACASSSGNLGLLKAGKCPKGSHSIRVSAQSPAASLPRTLPSGETETGAFFVGSLQPGLGDYSQISFTVELKADLPKGRAPSVRTTTASGDRKHCTGSYDNPTAARGYLCLYLASVTNAVAVTPLTLVASPGASRSGAIIEAGAKDSTNSLQVTGSWAVTAP